jgi:uncharacterized protein (DUF1810 family)
VEDPFQLQRFVDAQQGVIEHAIGELGNGRKESHWMWFIFPQLAQLGRSPTAKYYGIGSLDEARAYLAHPQLGSRLKQSVDALLPWAATRSAEEVLGPIDALKLRSSLTLFEAVQPDGPFSQALSAFYAGVPDQATLALLNAEA